MPIVKVYLNGLTMGSPPSKNDHKRAKRGEVVGWSESAARNNKKFLYSVDTASLSGVGYAFTLTLKTCPATSEEWRDLRERFFTSITKSPNMRFIRLHWVVEWQRRGVPHLHGIVFYDDRTPEEIRYRMDFIVNVWVGLTSWYYETKAKAQHVTVVTDVSGWFKYLSKHAARGADHYQRSNENIPEGWRKTGRVWGHKGDWVIGQPREIELSREGYYAFRRIVRAWRKADARAEKDLRVKNKRIVYARRMLTCGDRRKSEVRGVSEWINSKMAEKIIWNLVALGFDVTERIESA